MTKIDFQKNFPQHVAIICDGNRRWAKSRGWKAFRGHEYAIKNTMDSLVEKALKLGLKYLTFWIFSTENWKRDPQEVKALMNLFRQLFDEKIQSLSEKKIRVKVIGDVNRLDPDIQERIKKGEKYTQENSEMTIIFAINYGGRDEILRAVKKISEQLRKGQVSFAEIEQFQESDFAIYLDTSQLPDPDLIIRTSGEHRLSGFMAWQQQYSEFYFSQSNFPDFDGSELEKAIIEYQGRKRNFGQ